MSRLLRVGDKVINLDNIEYIIRDESNVVRIHFIHGDIELWNEQGAAFRQWVLSNAEYCEGSGEGW
jgi:pyruvate kinase